jgi:mono/diheme cytochrome c family protein
MPDQTQTGADNGAGRRWSVAEAWVVGIGAGLVVIALMGIAYAIGYNNGQDDSEPAAAQQRPQEAEEAASPTAETEAGRELFASACGSCHTLADAETSGTTGPSLDALQPEASTVEAAIRDGGAGTGAMPAGIYSGKEAEQVAAYVATVAGEG